MKKILPIILTLMISLAMVGCNLWTSDSKMKSIIKEKLIDGESAQFSDLKYNKAGSYVCGYVNSKNRMGGYAGKKKFVVSLESNNGYIEPGEGEDNLIREGFYAHFASCTD